MSDSIIKVGFGATDLTPPPGLEMSGFSARTETATGAHDPLFARVLYIEEPGGPEGSLLLITFDLIGMAQKLVGEIKQGVREKYGLPADRVILACSHTHGGPNTLDNGLLGKHNHAYLAAIPGKVIEAAGQAVGKTVPANLHLNKAQAENAGKNRNVEGGPMDTAVGVLAVTDPASNELLGVVLNYTCHPTVLGPKNLLYTADYPFYTNRLVAEKTGLSHDKIFFTQGACGNINAGHTAKSSMTSAGLNLRTYEEAEKLGGNVGKAALDALENIRLDPEKFRLNLEENIPVVAENVNLDWNPALWATPAGVSDFRREKEAVLANGEWNQRADASVLVRWSDTMLQEKLDPAWPPMQASLTAARLDRLNLVTVPGELYVQYGLALKEKAGQTGQSAWLLGYTNGDLGYYPTPDAFERKDYEAATAYRYYGWPGPFTDQVGEHIGAAALDLLDKISEN
jgi:neutral ceramidase